MNNQEELDQLVATLPDFDSRMDRIKEERCSAVSAIQRVFLELYESLGELDKIKLIAAHDTKDSPVVSATLCQAMGVDHISSVRSKIPIKCDCGEWMSKVVTLCRKCRRSKNSQMRAERDALAERDKQRRRQDFVNAEWEGEEIGSLLATAKKTCKCGDDAVFSVLKRVKKSGEDFYHDDYNYLCPRHAGQFLCINEVDLEDLNRYEEVVNPADAKNWKQLARETMPI